MRLPNAPPGLPHHLVPALRGPAPAYIRTGMRFTLSLHCCADTLAKGRTAPVHPHVRHAPWFCAVRMPPDLRRPPVSALKAFLHTFWGADS